ncbi:putative efflux protein, MATE family [Hathewaya proteolytica DSM 3090]|uniref:Probable multidrug resistance protein NorM n=1 Tax=Hathewaya proteolytica DSM 3090 TaxID=1121331 RepID=A0A1M6PRD3_9CLOT|nr:MATE family efflux transporter [Hathewaya proteolytica]SHK10503.1 putative efflux protein, MATE family [Hathewaya proteolytica DSM 3090]
MIKDLTIGNPGNVLFKLSLPMFISVIFQQLYNIADSIIAGRFAGESALAAVGASYPITMIFMAVAIGSNIGCSVVISQFFGAKNYKKMKTAISTTMISSLILSLLLTIIGLASSGFFMSIIKTPSNIFEQGKLYLNIYILGFILLFLYNICTGIFTALGDSSTPLYFLIGSSIGNVVLDYVFVAVFHWGVAGVAWATFIAQGIACILALFTLLKRVKEIKAGVYEKFSIEMLKRISNMAIPSILQQSFVSIGNIFIQGLVNSYGSSAIAGYSAAIKLNTFAITSFATLGNGMSNFTAQNVGAGKSHRVKEGYKSGILMVSAVALAFFAVYFFASNSMINLFMDSTGPALKTGTTFLKIVTPFYIIVAVKLLTDGVLRGASAMKEFMISTFTDLILRVVISFILASFFGEIGIWMSWPIGWTMGMILSVIYYRRGTLNRK